MKNYTLLSAVLLIGGVLVLASSTFAGYGRNTSSGNLMGMRGGSGSSFSGMIHPNYSLYRDQIVRTVTNIANGVEITLTTTDPATLKHLQASLVLGQEKTPRNTEIQIQRTALPNGTKLTVTSSLAETVKEIQVRALEAKYGVFGGGMMGQGGHIQGKGNRGQRGGCQR